LAVAAPVVSMPAGVRAGAAPDVADVPGSGWDEADVPASGWDVPCLSGTGWTPTDPVETVRGGAGALPTMPRGP
jgi:hypothetical protein